MEYIEMSIDIIDVFVVLEWVYQTKLSVLYFS